MDSALRPKDIQARIRSGESPETVAAAAGTSLDKIMGFAGPVMAERAHVAQSAQKASVRRRSSGSGGSGATPGVRTLGEAALVALSELKVAESALEWDSWRRPDGRWTLVADYVLDGEAKHAEFSYDQPGRYVVAEDDEARRLTGELPSRPVAEPPPPASAPPGRRLSSVPAAGPAAGPAASLVSGSVSAPPSAPLSAPRPAPPGSWSGDQDELPLGDDAIAMVRDPEVASPPASSSDTATGLGDPPLPEPGDRALEPEVQPPLPTADADWMGVAVRQPDEDAAAAARAEDPSAGSFAPDGPTDGAAPVEEPVTDEQESVAEQDDAPSPRRRKGRSSVPSWDEIMFGGSGE